MLTSITSFDPIHQAPPAKEASYKLSFRAGNETVSEWLARRRNNGTEQKEALLQFNRTGTHKVMLEASFLNQTQEARFRTR